MSQTKAQLVAPVGVVTASGVVVSGVMTAGTFDGDIVGSATSIIQGTNLNLGAFNATSFAGDFTGNATGIITSSAIKVGQLTASSFVGDFTGTATSMARGTGFEAGAVTGSAFVADVTGNVTGNATGLAGSVTQGTHIHVGVVTATSLYGDGSNMTGIAATNFNTQTVTANGAATTIDLSAGNVITFNQSADTTVSLANTSEAMSVTLIRVKDASATARTITWPSSVKWNGNSAPTLISDSQGNDKQQFQFITRDSGVTWYAWEPYKKDSDEYSGLFLWGDNDYGRLGQNQPENTNLSSPTQLSGEWNKASGWNNNDGGSSSQSTARIKTDGTLWIWGGGEWGQLGLNVPQDIDQSSPVQLPGTTWAIVGGSSSKGAIKTDGTLWAWGQNYLGALGTNGKSGTGRRSSPTQIGTETTYSTAVGKNAITQGNRLNIKTDGTLWAVGDSEKGQLGLNQSGPGRRSSPTQVGTDTTWDKVAISGSTGNSNVTAIKTDGTLWTWGENGYGGLGLNTPANQDLSSPTQVGTDTTWSHCYCGNKMSMATKTNGTLWAWGSNTNGKLGFNNTTEYSSPKQIPGTNWKLDGMGTANEHTSACIKTDGTLWMWGSGIYGQLGDNEAGPTSRVSSPVQIPGTGWGDIQGQNWGFAATKKVY